MGKHSKPGGFTTPTPTVIESNTFDFEDFHELPEYTTPELINPPWWRKATATGAIAVVAVGVSVAVIMSMDKSEPIAQVTPEPPPVAAPAIPPSSQQPPPPPSPSLVTDTRFIMYGDGLTTWALGFSPVLGLAGTTYDVVSDNSLTPEATADIIEQGAQDGSLPDVVIFAHGTSHEVSEDTLNRIITALGPRRLVLVGAGTSDPAAVPWAQVVNDRYRVAAARHATVSFVDWQASVDAQPSVVETGDAAFLLTEEGAHVWARDITVALSPLYDPATLARSAHEQRSRANEE